MSQPAPKITISIAQPEDYYPIAALETLTFHNEPFSAVAFGPLRDHPSNIQRRATSLAKQPSIPDGTPKTSEWNVVAKAVDENGIIVGVACWGFVTGRAGKVEEKGEGIGGGRALKQEDWGLSANLKFCEEVFLKGDELMLDSCKGEDYAKLSVLVVSPSCQRRGIGTNLLEHGLKEVDKNGLQCVLGASKEGFGLYKKLGWVPYETMKIKLWEYEGGEGMGVDEHVIMNRPAKKL
ncbi:uncharacterized protein PAC_10408 [Phialocephala subalpina]|uniref:N-acetyltransferase domain-containing protein n=1 Tax=Phialocephala subalpina TaxID=576137 RepID=A0A1L7X681_9HELO|nr:uncharacterized protein PAC_10408 [Phialocephala subalpina]